MLHEEATVLVPQDRLSEFYGRFGDFMLDRAPADPASDSSVGLHQIGTPPAETAKPGAVDVAQKFWRDVTDPGRKLLRVLIDGTERENSPCPSGNSLRRPERTTQAVDGTFGGIGRVIADHGLPSYEYAPGKSWHFVGDWDPKKPI